MKKSKFWKAISLLAVLALILPTSLAGAARPPEKSYFVSVAPADLAALFDLGLSPRLAIDYGAFRWLEFSEADFEALQASGVPFVQDAEAGQVRVMDYRFDPLTEGEPDLPANMRAESSAPGLRLVKLAGPTRSEWLSRLDAVGLHVLQYYPHYTYLVWGSEAQARSVEALDFVRWQGAFHPGYRISSGLAGWNGWVENVAVTFYNDGKVDNTLMQIASLGGVYIQHFPAQPDKHFYTAIFALHTSALEAVARLNTVWIVEYSSPRPGLDDEMGTQIIAGNYTAGVPFTGYEAWLTAKGVDGSGIRWADVDTGLNASHPDLTGRAVAFVTYPGAPPANTDPDGHGSHTAGAIMGDGPEGVGVINPAAAVDPSGFYWGTGTAPEAELVVQNALIGSDWPPVGGWQLLSKDTVLNAAIGSSNSWFTGASGAQGYSAAARTHDIMVRDANFDTPAVAEPIIMVFSAGNAGPSPSTITEPKEAKNLITVGASINYRNGDIDDMASFSSRGPALDGRLLPNVIAPGYRTASLNGSGVVCDTPVPGPGSTYYNYCQGTSMACPFVSGAGALIADWWDQEFGTTPSPAMTKALLINSAVDMVGGSGVGGNIPNNNQGWGRVNMDDAIRNDVYNIYHDQDVVLSDTGQSQVYSFGVGDPTKPVKISLVWADAPGAVMASPALVNNLNLTVTNGGNTYRGNVFLNGWSTTGGSYDALNNIENVYIQSPASGLVIITIDAANIAGDGVPYNGDATDQDFALVCYNCLEGPDFTLEATPDFQEVCALATPEASYNLTTDALLGFSQPVTLTTSGAPAGAVAAFDPNPILPPATGVLTLSNLVSATWGVHTIDIVGAAITRVHTATVGLELYTILPDAPQLLTPAAESTGVPLRPTFTWSAVEQVQSYAIDIATDAAFTNIVDTAAGLTLTTYTPAADLTYNTIYYWRVWADNTCGQSAPSAVFRFLTEATVGQCTLGTTAVTLFEDGFESGAAGWEVSSGNPTWELDDTRAHGGTYSFKASEPSTVSDQWLVSPAFTVPADQSLPIVEYYDYRRLQSGGCYDGGLLEVSTDDGVTWEQVMDDRLLTMPYEGKILRPSNPLHGLDAWCITRSYWASSIVSLADYAGETVRLRFHFGTDNSGSYDGWYLDDVKAQSCMPSATLGPDSSLEASPATVVTHTFVLANETLTDTFALSIEGNLWPTTLVGAAQVTVTQGASVTLAVQVDAPLAAIGESDAFTLTAASANIPGLALTTHGETTIVAAPAVDITPISQTQTVEPGGMVTYVFTLTNSGDFTDTFNLDVTSVWTATLSVTTTAPVAAGENVTITLTVWAPADAAEGAHDVATLTATSGLDGDVQATAEVDTVATLATRLLYLPIIMK